MQGVVKRPLIEAVVGIEKSIVLEDALSFSLLQGLDFNFALNCHKLVEFFFQARASFLLLLKG